MGARGQAAIAWGRCWSGAARAPTPGRTATRTSAPPAGSSCPRIERAPVDLVRPLDVETMRYGDLDCSGASQAEDFFCLLPFGRVEIKHGEELDKRGPDVGVKLVPRSRVHAGMHGVVGERRWACRRAMWTIGVVIICRLG